MPPCAACPMHYSERCSEAHFNSSHKLHWKQLPSTLNWRILIKCNKVIGKKRLIFSLKQATASVAKVIQRIPNKFSVTNAAISKWTKMAKRCQLYQKRCVCYACLWKCQSHCSKFRTPFKIANFNVAQRGL